MNNRKIVGYARVSCPNQAKSGLGIKRQIDTIIVCARKLDAKDFTVFSDEGLSGGLPIDKRPALIKALSELEKDSILIVESRDRLSRSIIIAEEINEIIEKKGASIICTDEYTDAYYDLRVNIHNAFAEYKIKTTRTI